jgi:adenosylcobinamide-phosphate synthase
VSPQGLAVAAGLVTDRLVGDPPDRWHPVAWFGSAMAALERRSWRDDRGAGALHAAAGVGAAGLAGATLAAAGRASWRPATTMLATVAVVGGRSLDRAAGAVDDALRRSDLPRARTLLPALVGRDPSRLDESEVARAVVESVAENTVDAVVAPALWCILGGPAGAAAYRAVNTLDAMVGHRSERYLRFGWASARLDDAANLVPARVTALLVAVVRPRRAPAVWRAVRTDAPAHPSPNAGVAEAAFAAALGLQLGGVNTYGDRLESRPPLGAGRGATAADIARARRLASDVTAALVVASVLPSVLGRTGRRPAVRHPVGGHTVSRRSLGRRWAGVRRVGTQTRGRR